MRAFSLTEGTSDKFWHIDVINDTITVHFGRNGTKGQVKTTGFASAADAAAEAEKLIASKVAKGYLEYDATSTMPPAATPPTQPAAAPAPAASPPPPAPTASAPATPAPAAAASEPSAAVTARPLAPAAGAVPSTLDPDDLAVELTRMEEASLGWGRPLDSYQPATTFDVDATEAWVRRNVFRLSDSTSYQAAFPTQPFVGVPSPDEARWWLWWYQLDESWRPPPLNERLAQTRAGYESGQLPPPNAEDFTPLHYDNFIVTASEVALVNPAALVQGLINYHGWVERLLASRALIIRQLDEPTRQRWFHKVRTVAPPHLYGQLALFATPEDYAEAVMSAPAGTIKGSLGTFAETLAPLPDPTTARAMFARLAIAEDDTLSEWIGRNSIAELPIALAAAGPDVLPHLVNVMVATTNSATIGSYLKMLTPRVHGPGAVSAMVRLARESRAPEAARAWLVSHPESLAATSTNFTAAEADFLEAVTREILASRPDAFAGGVQNPTVAALVTALHQEASTVAIQPGEEPSWWHEASAAEAAAPVLDVGKGGLPIPAKLPPYATAGALPSVIIDGDKLSSDMVEALIWSAVRGANDPGLEPRPLVAAARQRMDRATRDRLGSALFDGWMSSGAPSNQRSLFVAAGFLGSEGFVHRLVPLVRNWPGESQHQRAVLGLTALAATGTKSALQGISGIASKSKFKGVQEAAQKAMAVLAALQGLTPDQLADQVVPDGGLDDRGTRVFSYGPRSFQVGLSPLGKLQVRDLDANGQPVGKVRTALPAPNSSDDEALAATAKSDFTVLRKQLTELAKIQTARLEQAMVTGRTWSVADHREYLVGNPLLNSLIRPLVWEIFDDAGRTLVRVTDEREYLTIDDAAWRPADAATVRMAHPLDLTETERSTWQHHLADYDLISPVEQLDRAVFAVPADLSGLVLPAGLLPQGSIHPGTLISILEREGWRRGNPVVSGVVGICWLGFPDFDQAVAIDLADGLYSGNIADSGDQRITAAVLLRPDGLGEMWSLPATEDGLDWAEVNPRVYSETQRTFALLAEKMV